MLVFALKVPSLKEEREQFSVKWLMLFAICTPKKSRTEI